jgi:hypothetical protein
MYASVSFFVAGKKFIDLIIFKPKVLNLMREFHLFLDLKGSVK